MPRDAFWTGRDLDPAQSARAADPNRAIWVAAPQGQGRFKFLAQKSYTDRIKALVSRPPGEGFPPVPIEPQTPIGAPPLPPSDTTRGAGGRPPSGPIIFSAAKQKKDKSKPRPKLGAVGRSRRALPANDWRVVAMTVASVALAVLSLVLVWILAVIRPKMQSQIAELQARREMEARKSEELAKELATKEQELIRAHSRVGVLRVETRPPGALATFAGRTATCPTNFDEIALGTHTLTITLNGYETFAETITVTNDVPITREIQLAPSVGQLLVDTEPQGAAFTVKRNTDVIHEGRSPAKISGIPVGAYLVHLKRGAAEHLQEIEVGKNQTAEVRHRFRLGRARVETEPPGAEIVHKGTVLGKTPAILTEIPEGPWSLELRLRKYLPKPLAATIVADQETRVFGRLEPNLGPPPGKDFTTSTGIEMVWLSEGLWVSRHEVTQGQYLAIMGSDPSRNKGSLRPVDSVTWKQAVAFCEKLSLAEDAAESLPAGFRFTLPTESEWLGFAGPLQPGGVVVLGSTLGTVDVTRAPANGLGLRGIWGNVWEWCLDEDDRGRVLRGGGWTPIYDGLKQITDRTTASEGEANPSFGFRVILKKR